MTTSYCYPFPVPWLNGTLGRNNVYLEGGFQEEVSNHCRLGQSTHQVLLIYYSALEGKTFYQ